MRLRCPRLQLRPEVLVQRLLLPLLPKPQRLAGFQIAHYRQKLVLLPPVDLIHAHLFQRWLTAPLVPTFQIAQVDRAHRGLRQVESPRHLTGGGALAGFPDDLFESLAERRLGRQLLDLFHPHSAFRASQAMYFHDHGRTVYAPGQVPDLPLSHVMHFVQTATASAALKPSVNRLAPHPQLQCSSPLRPPRADTLGNLATPESPSIPCESTPECTEKRHLTESSIFECFYEFLRRASKSEPVSGNHETPTHAPDQGPLRCLRQPCAARVRVLHPDQSSSSGWISNRFCFRPRTTGSLPQAGFWRFNSGNRTPRGGTP